MLYGSSPHTRGARIAHRQETQRYRIIPAYAGSTEPRPTARGGDEDHPRIRGEHAALASQAHSIAGSSPHTRGAQTHTSAPTRHTRIIPAYAGSTPRRRLQSRMRADHPRIRGEHNMSSPIGGLMGGSSPHTRGARSVVVGGAGGGRIIPAYAGSTNLSNPRPTITPDHPRIRGEHPGHHVHQDDPDRIIPAYAGSTSALRSSIRVLADHPRIRGEHPVCALDQVFRSGSSPHTRGAQLRREVGSRQVRIIPAYAGSTPSPVTRSGGGGDHPRIRGEHALALLLWRGEAGSSPHTRGAHGFANLLELSTGIIPAYAGSTAACAWTTPPTWDHPRIRGEHAQEIRADIPQWGSSPHTRGAHPKAIRRLHHERIIPAYAGSTRAGQDDRRRNADHPRIRGEHTAVDGKAPLLCGSSPHTRGAHTHASLLLRAGGIIPAYAGSTVSVFA